MFPVHLVPFYLFDALTPNPEIVCPLVEDR